VHLVADLEMGCCRFNHPCWQAGERAVGLEYDNEFDAAAFEPPSDLHHFAKPRMVTIGNPGFSRLFTGSMPPFRAIAVPP